MNKVIGYIVSVIGLGILSLGAGDFNIPLISSLSKVVVSTVAMVFIVAGVVIIIINSDKSKGHHGKGKPKSGGKVKDLPVYEGDDIIAYRRD